MKTDESRIVGTVPKVELLAAAIGARRLLVELENEIGGAGAFKRLNWHEHERVLDRLNVAISKATGGLDLQTAMTKEQV